MGELFLCSVCQKDVDNKHSEEDCLERVCEQVHKAYCQYQLDNGKEYWTNYNMMTGERYITHDDGSKEIIVKSFFSEE